MTRCYCTAELRPDGTCRHACPPELKPSRLRRQAIVARERAYATRVDAERWTLPVAERAAVAERLARFDPQAAKHRAHGLKAARKRHGRGRP